MSADQVLPVLVRWVHILSAVVLLGGILFYRLVLLPALRGEAGQRAAALEAVDARWKRWVHATIGLSLLTGLYNFFTISIPKGRSDPGYHAWFGAKFLLALCLFTLASVLVGRAPAFDRVREQSSRWYLVAALLGMGVILISGVLRVLG